LTAEKGMKMKDQAMIRKVWQLESELGQEKTVVRELKQAIRASHLPELRVDEIATAVSEACLNAIEHGNRCAKDVPVNVTMLVHADRILFRICDRGSGTDAACVQPSADMAQAKDKIGQRDPRGWGLLLMRHYADEVRAGCEGGEFCVELLFRREPKGGERIE